MLKNVLAISGKPGLYKLVSRGNKMLIVESVDELKKRMPAYGAEKVVSLADISIYTDDDSEVPLSSVFESIREKYAGCCVEIDSKKASSEDIITFFESILPNYDTDRVRVCDMRKVLQWYNILIADGFVSFKSAEETNDVSDK